MESGRRAQRKRLAASCCDLFPAHGAGGMVCWDRRCDPQLLDIRVDNDRTLSELKKLREGRGARADRLARSPSVLSSCATSDAAEAVGALNAVVGRMGDSERVRALKVDFGWELEELLGRRPGGRELEYLGERRASYAEVIGRDVKTLARWSDRAIGELRAQLLNDHFDGNVVVAAGVKNRRVTGIEVMRYEAGDDEFRHGTNVGYQNPEETSLPLVLYGFPRDWRPKNIMFIVAFLDGELPRKSWALVADSVLDVSFGHDRTEVEIDDQRMARCRIENPRRDQLYGVWWEW